MKCFARIPALCIACAAALAFAVFAASCIYVKK